MRVRAVVFDLFVTLTDFDAERRRPELEAHLAGALGVDPVAFRPLMRETFPDRVTGGLGDSRSTLSALALRLGRDLAPEALDEVVALRQAHQRHLLTPRAGAVEALESIHDAGYGMTPVLLETPFGADVRYDPEAHWSGATVEELSELRHLLVDAQTW